MSQNASIEKSGSGQAPGTRPQGINAAQDARRTRNAWLANKNQELLGPVSGVIELVDMMLQDARERGNPEFLADLQKIQAGGRKLLELIHETLDPAKTGANEVDFGKKIRHQLRTPLNHVIGYCELWIEEAPELLLGDFVPDLHKVRVLGKQTLQCLDDIVHFTQMATAPALDLTSDELPEMVRHVVVSLPFRGEELRPSSRTAAGPLLVVDDNDINSDILCRWLRREGHKTAVACNGREALEMVRAQPFDLVLLDIIMPELNGFQVLEQLKADDRLRHIPVIMISAFDEIDSVVRCLEMGAEDYLAKPFNPVLLKARLDACLEKKMLRDREVLYLEQIRKERERADELLHVILPAEIVDELKATNAVKPRRYDNVAVLFCDIVGFTPYCDCNQPEHVVSQLQAVIEAWEEVALRHGVEKIKTIGDAFMAAAGLLRQSDNPVLTCIRCGLDMIAAIQTLPSAWKIRIGIDAGPVVAGVIGRRQYLFDLWGDTVNTAARMESHGIPNAITLTQSAWDQVKHCCSGSLLEISIKGKGPMKMFCFEKFLCPENAVGTCTRPLNGQGS